MSHAATSQKWSRGRYNPKPTRAGTLTPGKMQRTFVQLLSRTEDPVPRRRDPFRWHNSPEKPRGLSSDKVVAWSISKMVPRTEYHQATPWQDLPREKMQWTFVPISLPRVDATCFARARVGESPRASCRTKVEPGRMQRTTRFFACPRGSCARDRRSGGRPKDAPRGGSCGGSADASARKLPSHVVRRSLSASFGDRFKSPLESTLFCLF